MEIIYWILLMTFLDGIIALTGMFLLSFQKKKLIKILPFTVAFTTGALLGGAFFHFLPESLPKIGLYKTGILTIIGFILFLITERFLYWHHCHEGDCEHAFTYLLLYGDAIHNFIDGIIIATSFIISIPFGIITSILIIAHELPQEIGTYGVLLYGKLDKIKALLFLFLAQLTAVLGGIIGYFFIPIKDKAIFLMPIAAGGFFYIAIGDLIPEIFKEKRLSKVIINLIIILLGISLLISAKLLVK